MLHVSRFTSFVLKSVDRNGSLWIVCNFRLPTTAFLMDPAIRQEQTAVY
jgi:hypothetical protein